MERTVRAHDDAIVCRQLRRPFEQQLAQSLRVCRDVVPMSNRLTQSVSALLDTRPRCQPVDPGTTACHGQPKRLWFAQGKLKQHFVWPQSSLDVTQRHWLSLDSTGTAEQFCFGGSKVFLGDEDLIEQPSPVGSIGRSK